LNWSLNGSFNWNRWYHDKKKYCHSSSYLNLQELWLQLFLQSQKLFMLFAVAIILRPKYCLIILTFKGYGLRRYSIFAVLYFMREYALLFIAGTLSLKCCTKLFLFLWADFRGVMERLLPFIAESKSILIKNVQATDEMDGIQNNDNTTTITTTVSASTSTFALVSSP